MARGSCRFSEGGLLAGRNHPVEGERDLAADRTLGRDLRRMLPSQRFKL
jgi:hypothetical protein